MAHDALSPGLARPRIEPWILDAAFLALLLLSFVGMQPFALRNPATDLELGPYTVTGGGDTLRQAFYGLLICSIGAFAFLRRGLSMVRAVPPMLIVVLLWCLLSASWAAAPDVTVRRAGLAIVVAVSTMLCADAIGADRAFRIWWFVLAGALIVNWLSIPLVHQSVHLPGEQDPGLVGDWRGLYFHKNIAGAVSAISAIVFLFSALRTKRWIDIALCLAAIGFVVMTRSKSSLGLLVVASALGLTYRYAWRRGIDRTIVATAGLFFVFLLTAFLVLDADMIARLLEDPTEFTGRAAIWQAEIAFIRDHPFLGSGFGTFADTGSLSPLHNYVAGSWVEAVAHGHSGYLQLLVTIGGIGFALTVLALIAAPAVQFWRQRGGDLNMRAMLFAIFAFLVLHNFMESDFLEGDAPAWVSFLLMLAFLRAPKKDAPR
jgi:exopolysaccharide production protein ExoQ